MGKDLLSELVKRAEAVRGNMCVFMSDCSSNCSQSSSSNGVGVTSTLAAVCVSPRPQICNFELEAWIELTSTKGQLHLRLFIGNLGNSFLVQGKENHLQEGLKQKTKSVKTTLVTP
eukprot:1150874-Pelagomonas_calceolata.AAC.4